MSRKFITRDDYMENEKEQLFSPENNVASEETLSGENNIAYIRKLSLDTDIFSGLPEFVFENKKVDRFLNVLKNVIATSDLEGVTLSKLHWSTVLQDVIGIWGLHDADGNLYTEGLENILLFIPLGALIF